MKKINPSAYTVLTRTLRINISASLRFRVGASCDTLSDIMYWNIIKRLINNL